MCFLKTKDFYIAIFLIICSTKGHSQQPVYSYLDTFSFKDTASIKLSGPARTITYKGRTGLNMTSVRSVLELKAHNLRNSRRTLSLWIMPLEELSSFDTKDNILSQQERSQGWTLLFDGKTGRDWMKSDDTPFPARGWKIKEGILTIKEDQKAGDIVTTGEYADFELKADCRIGPADNNGIKYFYTDYPTGGGLGMEYLLLDDKGASDNRLPNHLFGSLYDIFPPDETVKKLHPLGEWNLMALRHPLKILK